MSTPGTSLAAGSQAAAAGASSAAGSQVQAAGASPPVTCVSAAALTGAGPSDSGAPPSDSATAGTEDVIEIDDDVHVGSKKKLKSKVWLEFDRV